MATEIVYSDIMVHIYSLLYPSDETQRAERDQAKCEVETYTPTPTTTPTPTPATEPPTNPPTNKLLNGNNHVVCVLLIKAACRGDGYAYIGV